MNFLSFPFILFVFFFHLFFMFLFFPILLLVFSMKSMSKWTIWYVYFDGLPMYTVRFFAHLSMSRMTRTSHGRNRRIMVYLAVSDKANICLEGSVIGWTLVVYREWMQGVGSGTCVAHVFLLLLWSYSVCEISFASTVSGRVVMCLHFPALSAWSTLYTHLLCAYCLPVHCEIIV